ncbi:D-inositol-3-phosphate glycosyltransferase [Nocardioides sp. GY 10127]|uniref:D-inositol-3-phosphate glycosyltransferase n=1 Tax=Nocardioides sp. GY 10127 TaxID=2569762 RepID=UPI0010A8BFEF|nr:D-inositol-3-phosphate glycosyltransferase [Nocardioides sp. GY 10127]TIC78945.1 D-inositol-3-phosphate glycosyltransferase [Nocardioides sp. GY 10127]
MISLHTSPLDQPGTGDAGGMNVYVIELARRLAARGVEVDVFTRATSSAQPPVVVVDDGIAVHHVPAGPFEGLTKAELPGQLCVFAREVLRTEAAQPLGHYDVVHSHYWLSGQVGALARDRWGVPLVHSMHTMAKVKNESLAEGDTPEPAARVIGEEQVVAASDLLVANTELEARQLIDHYDADPARVQVVHPGVDLERFRPLDAAQVRAARAAEGIDEDALVVLFAGRIQPLKAPDVLLRAVAVLLEREPGLRERLLVPVVGGPSGSGLEHPESLADLASELGLTGVPGRRDVVRFVPPVDQDRLARWYGLADVVAVPSYNESFGLVAAEAQASGTPVVAAAVGGLPTVVRDGRSGLLVPGHAPAAWADALGRLLLDDDLRARLTAGARPHASAFSWEATAEATVACYEKARALLSRDAPRPALRAVGGHGLAVPLLRAPGLDVSGLGLAPFSLPGLPDDLGARA